MRKGRFNQKALLCAECKVLSHASCLGLNKAGYRFYSDCLDVKWTCTWCSPPFRYANLSAEETHEPNIPGINVSTNIDNNNQDRLANKDPFNSLGNSILEERKNDASGAFIMHLNINSVQNTSEELKILNSSLKALVLVISETKIDESYPSGQFSLPGYHMYRKDRKKGSGGLIAYFSTALASRRLALPKSNKTLEAIAIESKIGRNDVLFLSIYRPPKQKPGNENTSYMRRVEEELNDLCQWASFQKQTIVILGDLNTNRMKPNYGEGKILKDLEEVNSLKCMIEEPPRITTNSETLLDVILTNAPKMFKKCGTYEPEISDHRMIYGELTEKVRMHKIKTITFRQTKKTDFEELNRDLIDAPWYVGDIFSNSDEKYDYWRALFESIVDKHAPMKKKRVREKDIPYMTAEWKQAIRNKRKYAVHFAKNRLLRIWN